MGQRAVDMLALGSCRMSLGMYYEDLELSEVELTIELTIVFTGWI